MVEKFLEQTTFTSQEDFIKNFFKKIKNFQKKITAFLKKNKRFYIKVGDF